tara:strand:+ start:3304 stop:3528 length:225 start_codon:yes stop_codon:yes gene_type:complete
MTDEAVLDAYRMQLRHYFEKGIGSQSDLSKNTTITPKLVTMTFNRYLELGGTLDFISEYDIDEYNSFIEEIQAC